MYVVQCRTVTVLVRGAERSSIVGTAYRPNPLMRIKPGVCGCLGRRKQPFSTPSARYSPSHCRQWCPTPEEHRLRELGKWFRRMFRRLHETTGMNAGGSICNELKELEGANECQTASCPLCSENEILHDVLECEPVSASRRGE